MDIFTTQLAKLAPNRLQPKKLKVNRLTKQSPAKNIDEEREHLDAHDTTTTTFQHAKQQFSDVVDAEIAHQQNANADDDKGIVDNEKSPLSAEASQHANSPANTAAQRHTIQQQIDSNIQKRVEQEGVEVPSDEALAQVVYQRPTVGNSVASEKADEQAGKDDDHGCKHDKDHDNDQHLDIFV
ncbi:hypothetical protein DXX93_07520 [Thalassotalea euphylliae]|uniref:Uncharacterized protein n=1 Tax=Thalassotalea euphylliae TaxID=1655234 RepID=A0A3E0TPS7_9GAMM|nr:hypothetical protein [Thalassotalea euphylliae]REL26443.1 hypothetical protein DXX93_07520 [Thalassotalea euphylliae]